MERIANALGHREEFFLQDNLDIPIYNDMAGTAIAFYAGEPSGEQLEFAKKLIDLIENADEILGAKDRFVNAIMG